MDRFPGFSVLRCATYGTARYAQQLPRTELSWLVDSNRGAGVGPRSNGITKFAERRKRVITLARSSVISTSRAANFRSSSAFLAWSASRCAIEAAINKKWPCVNEAAVTVSNQHAFLDGVLSFVAPIDTS